MENKRNFAFGCKGIAAAVALTCAGHAFAYDFEVGDWKGSWTNTLSVGTAVRARNADPALMGTDAAVVGLNFTGKNTANEGNVNYQKGDAFSTLFKWFTEVEMKNGDMGFLVRGKAWYDYTLKEGHTLLGNEANGYNPHKPMKDTGYATLDKYSGVYLLDAYVYDSFDVAGNPLQVRLGNQVVNWGESVFIQGVNYVDPIDIGAYLHPGAQLKEVFIPVPMLYGNLGLGEKGSVEAFYQFKHVPTPLGSVTCSNYWAVAQLSIGTSPGGCQNGNSFLGNGPASLDPINHGDPLGSPLGAGVPYSAYIPTVRGPDAKDNGQWGLAYHINVAAIDTEIGAFYENLTARTPIVGAKYPVGGTVGVTPILGGTGTPYPGSPQYGTQIGSSIAAFWEYPEDIKVLGLSAATVIGGWSIGAELSQRRDFQVQIDGNDLLGGCLAFAGPAAGLCLSGANSAGKTVHGGTKANLTQFQVNGLNAGNGILNAGQWVAVWEIGAQKNNLPNYHDSDSNLRYNRPFVFGTANNPLLGGCTVGATFQNTPANCNNEGFVTKFAWGYRFIGWLTYTDVFQGINVIPKLFWSHDVKGFSADGQFVEDRQALALSVKFDYQKRYGLELGFTTYNHHARYDPLHDRDFYSATFTYNF